MSGKEVVYDSSNKGYSTAKNTNCKSKGVIYALVCTCKSRNTYVGQTVRPLLERLAGHRRDFTGGKNMPIYRHLRKKGHDFESMKVTVLEKLTKPDQDSLLREEEVWIRRLNSRLPKGLNSTVPTYHLT